MIAGIYNEKKDISKILYLNLRDDSYGCYTLFLVDEKGSAVYGGNILTIKSDGSLIRHIHINDHLGLNLDERGQLKEVLE